MNNIRPGSDEVAMAQASQLLKNMLNVGNGVQTNTKDLTDASYKSMFSEDLASGRAIGYGSLGEKTAYQEIAFVGDEDDEQTFKINGQEVVIRTNPKPHTSSSNRVKIKNVVDFSWEQKYHTGHLVATHVSGMYIAYTLIVQKAGVVRVVHLKTDKRQLIKGWKGQVKDLAFAHCLNAVILASVDEYGILLVHEITQQDNGLQCNVLLHMDRSDVTSSDHHLVFWCSYIPEDENYELDEGVEDNSRLLAVTHNKETEIFNVSFLSKTYGPGPIFAKDILVGVMIINEHSQPITAAVFSPDGTALATASLDGAVKFFEVHQEKATTPRCLHQWKPHGGRPISCLFFLDNHKSPKPEVQFWKFALTGTDFNQELKLWSCESWDCLQTLEFKPSSSDVVAPCMKVELDYSAAYLLLSDISNRVVYVLQIYQDVSQGEAHVCSIAQFLLTQSVLSLAIVDAVRCRIKPLTGEVVESHDKNDIERNGESECKDTKDKSKGVSIKIWWINTKSLQESHITYHPPVTLAQNADETMSVNSQDSTVFQDHLSDLSQDLVGDSDSISKPFLDMELPFRRDNSSTPVLNSNISGHSAAATSFNNSFRSNSSGTVVGEVLLTPDHFTSPSQMRTGVTVSPGSTPLATSTKSVESAIDSIEFKNQPLSKSTTASELALLSFPPDSEVPLATSEMGAGGSVLPPLRRKSSQVSSTSSLSQEVADILAPTKTDDIGTEGRSSNSPKLISPTAVSGSFHGALTNHLNSNMVEDRKTSPLLTWPPAPDIKGYKMASGDMPVDVSSKAPINYVNLTSVNSNSVPVKYTADNEVKAMLQKIQDSMNSLKEKQSVLESMLSNQGKEVRGEMQSQLQSEFFKYERLHSQAQQEHSKRLEKMESALYSQMDKATSQQAVTTQKRLEGFITKQWESEHKSLEKQICEVPQAATLAATSKLAENVHNVVKSTVVPEVTRFLESFRLQIQQEQNAMLATSEAALRDSISGLVKNKLFMDSLSSSVAISLQPQVQKVCREVLTKNLLPAMDKVCQNLFLQLNEAFKTGTRDYLSQAETFLETSNAKQNQCQLATLQKELKEQSAAIALSQQQHAHLIRDNVDKAISTSLHSFSEHLQQRLQSLVAEEVQGALESASQKGLFAVPVSSPIAESRAMTPAPKMIDPQVLKTQILTLIKLEQYNDAFQMALRATDISLVNMTIELVPPTKLFGDSSRATLKLPVLLSLLHQLGSSMDNNTDLKIQYLHLALMSMDTSDASCRHNQYQVLTPLREKLIALHKQTPISDLSRRIKMLALYVEGLLRSLEE